MFKITNLKPWSVPYFSLFFPYFFIIFHSLRSIFLEGADLPMVWSNIWPLLLIATLTLPSAALMFRKRAV
ncbi:MAG: hypothetical protein CSA32_01650 [Desulfobulbus propionicus]|nr:MAG: hypothetical protein CSA32_01650 [Desulfobulbus propionicus]